MPRGGSRPGAGRPSRNSAKPAASTQASKAKAGSNKQANGKTKTRPAKKPSPKSTALPAPVVEVLVGEFLPANMSPLEYMLQVMNDPKAIPDRRDRMAVAAAPFVHGKKPAAGLKGQRADAAATVGTNSRFSAATPPPRRPN